MADSDTPLPTDNGAPAADAASGDAPTEREDRERIARDEERLEQLDGDIAKAEELHHEHEKSWQSGLIPQAEGDEGEGNASKMRG